MQFKKFVYNKSYHVAETMTIAHQILIDLLMIDIVKEEIGYDIIVSYKKITKDFILRNEKIETKLSFLTLCLSSYQILVK